MKKSLGKMITDSWKLLNSETPIAKSSDRITAWKVSKYGVFFCPYFPVFGLNTGKYGPEKTPYLDTFPAVNMIWKLLGLMVTHFPVLLNLEIPHRQI